MFIKKKYYYYYYYCYYYSQTPLIRTMNGPQKVSVLTGRLYQAGHGNKTKKKPFTTTKYQRKKKRT